MAASTPTVGRPGRRPTPSGSTLMHLPEAARTDLDALLDAHRPADDAENDSLAGIRAFLEASEAPFDRRTLPGHLTGSAFVIDGAGRLLLVHHRRLGLWLQLGGHAEGETDAATIAAREAREESALTDLRFHPALRRSDGRPLLLDVDVHAIPASGDDPPHLHFDLRFLMVTAAPDDSAHDALESHAVAWVSLAEARRRCDAGIGRAVAKIERILAEASRSGAIPG